MYESYYGFREKPFSLQTDPSLLYMGKAHTAAYTMLEYGILNKAGFTVITGEIGSGKTTLLQKLLSNIQSDIVVGLVNNTNLNMGDLLPWVLHSFMQDYLVDNPIARYELLNSYLEKQQKKGKRPVLIIDEAQNLPLDVLEELRTLSNINSGKTQLLQIILLGQPELREVLRKPQIRQFAQRVTVDYHIPALELAETSEYIGHRMKLAGRSDPILDASACELIHYVSGGVPRVINVICDTVLSYGFADQMEQIDDKYVKGVLKERSEGGLLALSRDPENYFKTKNKKKLSIDELIDQGMNDGDFLFQDFDS